MRPWSFIVIFAESDLAAMPIWVQVVSFILGPILTGCVGAAAYFWGKYKSERRVDRADDVKTDKTVADSYRRALVDERERRGMDYAQYTKDRDEWQKQAYEFRREIDQLVREKNAIETKAAVMETKLTFQTVELAQMKMHLIHLGRVIKELKGEMPGEITDEYVVPEELRTETPGGEE